MGISTPDMQGAGLGAPMDVLLPGDQPQPQVTPTGAVVTEEEDGSVLVDLDPSAGAPGLAEMGWGANLAEALDESILSGIAADLLLGVEADDASRQEWLEQYAEGVKLLGIKTEQRDKPFPGAAGVYHPLMLEAVLRGHANARAEMLPAAGPVRVEIADDADPETEQQAQRKQTWLNYYLTTVYEGYYPDFDQMLLVCFISGSAFKKVYRDPVKDRPVAPSIHPKDLIVNYGATALEDASRITHQFTLSAGDLIRNQLAGYYRRIDLSQPTEDARGDAATEVQDLTDGRAPVLAEGDEEHTIYEVHCELDIDVPGLRHEAPNPDTGLMEPTGLPLPYIVTLDRDSCRVLRLARNWEQGDEQLRPRDWFVHYQLMPGLGFYGWGYAHVLGGSSDAATKLRRQIIDGGTLANFPGGFRNKGIRMDNASTIGPCEFVEIDTGGLPIDQVIMPLPYKEPGPTMAAALMDVVSSGQRVGNTMDMQVGDGRQDAPVGTTVALLEKAQRPETAQIKRLHTAHRKELRLLARLFGEEEGATYTYRANGQRGQAIAADFRDTEDVQPVSDPNNPTQTQRLAIAQATLQLAGTTPGMDRAYATQRMLVTLGYTPSEVQRLMPPPPTAVPLDPISEFANAMRGAPLAVGPQQVHQAHIIAHQGQVQIAQATNPGAAQALAAHIGEHVAALYRQQLQAMAPNIPLPPPGQPLPPQIEAQLAAAVAQATGPLLQGIQASMAPPAKGAAGPSPEELQMQVQENQIRVAELEQQREESERKAEQAARQDAVELERLRMTMADNAAEREQRRQDNQVKVIQEAARKGAADQTHATQQLGHVAQIVTGMDGLAGAAQHTSTKRKGQQ
ncbi:hypothetical protein ABNQ39_00105 (plasmid) [Azospirillum sp. A26]|uniref:hypothetical protein n=1 Tax=Azospirillum sp. A26 TaxID=3160607 RepID=UPI00366EAB6F